jgi:hypothetical protein
MTLVWVLLTVLIHSLTFGAFCAWVANSKGRIGGDWFLLGFFFGIFALLAVGFAPPATPRTDVVIETEDELPPRDERSRGCTCCGTRVAPTSRFCGNCGADVPVARRRAIRTRFNSAVG